MCGEAHGAGRETPEGMAVTLSLFTRREHIQVDWSLVVIVLQNILYRQSTSLQATKKLATIRPFVVSRVS